MGTPQICPQRPVSGRWSVLMVGLACVGAAVAEQMLARAGVLLTVDCTLLLLPRAPLIPTVPAGTTRERELGQP